MDRAPGRPETAGGAGRSSGDGPGTLDAAAATELLSARGGAAVHVVTSPGPDGRPSGCLVGFLTQCSLLPPRWLVCVSTANHTWQAVRQSDPMAIHLLGGDQHDLAEHFGGRTGDLQDKFTGVAWHAGRGGAPVLEDCAAWVEGVVLERREVGDHVACLVEPLGGGHGRRSGRLTLADVRDVDAGHPR
ncbi:MAG TPA: flavin reductase family protein [Acidimicrobiales bacterium]